MEAIYIPQLLKASEQTEDIPLQLFMQEIDTLTPIKGSLSVTHQGNYLEVSVQAETILTLTCDRCLQQYNHRLALDTSEWLWLDKKAEISDFLLLDKDLCQEDLSEALSPDGYFDVYNWLYEQLSLAMPLRQLCGKDCQPPATPTSDHTLQDSRWLALAALKDQLSN